MGLLLELSIESVRSGDMLCAAVNTRSNLDFAAGAIQQKRTESKDTFRPSG